MSYSSNEPKAFLVGREGPVISFDEEVDSEKEESRQAAVDFFRGNADRMKHFADRVDERGMAPSEVVVTCLDVDDPVGGILAEILMPSHDWQPYRDLGQIPVARGIAYREGISDFLADTGYTYAASAFEQTQGLAFLVIHSGAVLVLEADFE
ncbi:MAG: hypothetical protein AAF413_02430 [Patescibacteria group bacterium]